MVHLVCTWDERNNPVFRNDILLDKIELSKTDINK